MGRLGVQNRVGELAYHNYHKSQSSFQQENPRLCTQYNSLHLARNQTQSNSLQVLSHLKIGFKDSSICRDSPDRDLNLLHFCDRVLAARTYFQQLTNFTLHSISDPIRN